MPPASGLGSQFGIATETTPGTFVAPTTFLKFLTENLDLQKDYSKTAGLAAGLAAQDDSLHVDTTRHIEGEVSVVPLANAMGKLLNLLVPGTITPTGSGAAKTYAFPIGADVPDGKAASIQIGEPGTDGVVRTKSVAGCVITSITFAMERGGILTCSMNIWGKDLDTTQTLATAVYAAGSEPFSFLRSTLTIDGSAPSALVRSCSVTFTFPKADDRFGLNGSGTALTPITNNLIAVTGQYEMEFSGLAEVSAFQNASRRALSLVNLAKTDIQTGIKPALNIAIPKFVVVGDATPNVAGPDLITLSSNFEAVTTPGSPVATITYVTADTAI